MKKPSSLIDVARRAKVNISTVSRTINQTGKIGPETQARVMKAMRELGYKPNRVARRLRARDASTHLLGLIIPNIQNIFFADLARGVEDVAYKNNYAVLLCNYDEDEAKERFYLDVLQSESVDGTSCLQSMRPTRRCCRWCAMARRWCVWTAAYRAATSTRWKSTITRGR